MIFFLETARNGRLYKLSSCRACGKSTSRFIKRSQAGAGRNQVGGLTYSHLNPLQPFSNSFNQIGRGAKGDNLVSMYKRFKRFF